MGNKVVKVSGIAVEVVRKIADGGFSCVYLVREPDSGTEYALKRIICSEAEQVWVGLEGGWTGRGDLGFDCGNRWRVRSRRFSCIERWTTRTYCRWLHPK